MYLDKKMELGVAARWSRTSALKTRLPILWSRWVNVQRTAFVSTIASPPAQHGLVGGGGLIIFMPLCFYSGLPGGLF